MSLTVALAGVLGAGVALGNSVSYFYGASPTLMSTAGDSSALGSTSVSFMSQPPVVSGYVPVWGSDASSPYATVSYAWTGSGYAPSSGPASSMTYSSSYSYSPSPSSSSSSYSYSSSSSMLPSTSDSSNAAYNNYTYWPPSNRGGASYSAPTFTASPVWGSAPSSLYSTVSYYNSSSASAFVDMDSIIRARQAALYRNVTPLNVRPTVPVGIGLSTPEPSGIILVLGGLGMLFALRRRLAH